MQNNDELILPVAGEADNTKSSWHIPKISRVDIRRTLSGSGPSTDAFPGGFTL